jgi:hypothetical protein
MDQDERARIIKDLVRTSGHDRRLVIFSMGLGDLTTDRLELCLARCSLDVLALLDRLTHAPGNSFHLLPRATVSEGVVEDLLLAQGADRTVLLVALDIPSPVDDQDLRTNLERQPAIVLRILHRLIKFSTVPSAHVIKPATTTDAAPDPVPQPVVYSVPLLRARVYQRVEEASDHERQILVGVTGYDSDVVTIWKVLGLLDKEKLHLLEEQMDAFAAHPVQHHQHPFPIGHTTTGKNTSSGFRVPNAPRPALMKIPK